MLAKNSMPDLEGTEREEIGVSYINAVARLGEVLAEREIITQRQLQEAIRLQQERRELQITAKPVTIGEIMIELGYIDRYQLHRGLNWQSYLHQPTRAVTLGAPLMTMGCGGGMITSEEKPVARQFDDKVSKASEDAPSPEAATVKGPVDLSWAPPILREDGEIVDVDDLGGYELRYKLKEVPVFTYIRIQDPRKTEHHFNWLEGEYEFQIATYDRDGIYSNFVNLTRRRH